MENITKEAVTTSTSFWSALVPTICWSIGITSILYISRWIAQGGQFVENVSAKGKIVIITGANTGIGKETARDLAKRGATIYMACRDMKKAKEARNEIIKDTYNNKVYIRKLDLGSLQSIHEFVEDFKKDESHLHILINNAGVMFCPRSLTEDGFEQHIGINHLGHFYLTNLLLNMIKASAPSRIVNLSSRAHFEGRIKVDDLQSERSYGLLSAYGQSKLANILFTRQLSKILEGHNVTVNSVHPGVVDTELFRYIKILNFAPIKFVFKLLIWPLMKTPKSGAQTTLFAALSTTIEGQSGYYFKDCKVGSVSQYAKDDKMAEWLWHESERLTGLKKEH